MFVKDHSVDAKIAEAQRYQQQINLADTQSSLDASANFTRDRLRTTAQETTAILEDTYRIANGALATAELGFEVVGTVEGGLLVRNLVTGTVHATKSVGGAVKNAWNWVRNKVTRKAAADGASVAPTGRFGGVVANTAEEAAFLRNAAATFGDSSVFNAARRFDGSIIIQRSDIPFSVQNVRRMASGNTPFVRNSLGEWEKLNLHHVGRQDGKLIEIFSSHNTYNPTTGGPLHIPGPGSPIRDATFTRNYWMQRLQDAIDAGHVPQDVLRQAGL